MKKYLSLLALPFLVPAFAFAQVTTQVRDVNGVIRFIEDLVNTLIPLVIGLAILVFIWGVFRYVVASDEDAKERGKSLMIWGIVGIFVMTSVWGLVNLLSNTFGLDNSAIDIPNLNTQ